MHHNSPRVSTTATLECRGIEKEKSEMTAASGTMDTLSEMTLGLS